MNKFERLIYDAVKHNPDLKIFIRNLYQNLFSFLPVNKAKSKYVINTREGYFYGFHDHTPFSFNNEMLLANKYLIPLRYPKSDDPLEVGYFTGKNLDEWKPVGQTFAWNWHMGCKLQWVGQKQELIYNDFDNGKFVGKIYDVDKKSTRTIDHPIGSVSPDGNWAIGYSFERAQRYMPGYGYTQTGGEQDVEEKTTDKSGLYIVNLNTGEHKDIITLSGLRIMIYFTLTFGIMVKI